MKNQCNLFQLSLLFILLAILSCHRNSKKKLSDSTSFYTIPFNEIIKNQRQVNLSEIATDIEFIELENSSDALITFIDGMKLVKDYIFIDSGKSPIKQFSRDGKFIRQIGKIGRGPGEYDNCRIFSVDDKNRLIYIQGNALSKISVYNFTGKFVKSIEYPAIGRWRNVWSRDSFFVSFQEPMEGNEPYVFMEHNELGDTLQAIPNRIFWNNDEQYYNMYLGFVNPFYRFEEKLHMKSWYNDTVYTYNKSNRIVPKFFIDLGKHKLPDDLIYERKYTRPLPENLCWTGVHETSRYIFIPYGYHFDVNKMRMTKEEESCVIYDKETKEGITVEESTQWEIINDIDGGPDFRLNYYVDGTYINDTLALMPISAIELKQYLDSKEFKNKKVKFPEEKEKLNQLNKKLKEDDNFFLMLVKLKNR